MSSQIRNTIFNLSEGAGIGVSQAAYWATREPSGISVTITGSTTATVTWTDSAVSGADGYKVYAGAVLKATVAVGVQTASITGLTADTSYVFKVVAYKGANESTGITSTKTTFVTEYSDVYSEFTTKPSSSAAEAMNTMVKSIGTTILNKQDRFFVFAIHTNDNSEALLDWINPTGTPASLTYGSGGSIPTFQAYNGFKGNIVKKSIIDTQYDPSVNGVNYTLNKASLIVFLNDMPSYRTDNRIAGNHGGRVYLGSKYATNNLRGTLNSSVGNATNRTAPIKAALCSVLRKDANTTAKYVDGTGFGDEADAVHTSISPGNITVFSVEGTYFDDSQAAALLIGGSDEADLDTIQSALHTYINAVNTDYNSTATQINDVDDLYAHESQILIQSVGGVDYLLLMYVSNKVTNVEWQTSAKAKLKIFNLSTMALVKSFDLFYPGLVAGLTMPADKEICCPKMYVSGNTLYCYCPNTATLYKRTIDISGTDPSLWTASNLSIMQMTMKDAGGSNVLADVTSANIEIHLDYVLGDGYAGYHNLMPMFRNMDIAKSGANWYSTMQLSGERSHSLPAPTLCVTSTDSGVSWSFGSIIGYTIGARTEIIEPSVIFIGTTLHLISRATDILHYSSVDSGVTWTAGSVLPFFISASVSKVCAVNYTDGTLKNLLAFNISSQVTGDQGRTTVVCYSTDDFIVYNKKRRIIASDYCHYPSLFYSSGNMYISYTAGTASSFDRDKIKLANLGSI